MTGAGNDPIRVDCEAAGCPPVRVTTDPATFSTNGGMLHGMCPMCGQFVPIPLGHDINVMPPHERDDVLAMIERGDFG